MVARARRARARAVHGAVAAPWRGFRRPRDRAYHEAQPRLGPRHAASRAKPAEAGVRQRRFDMNQSPPNHAPRSTAERLQRAANELPTARDEAAISRIMYAVRTRPQKSAARRLAPLNRPAWFAAAATAMVAVVVLTVTRPDAPGPSSPGPTPLPVRMGQDIDPLLARSE